MATDAMAGLTRYLADELAFYLWSSPVEVWAHHQTSSSGFGLYRLARRACYLRLLWRPGTSLRYDERTDVMLGPPQYADGSVAYPVWNFPRGIDKAHLSAVNFPEPRWIQARPKVKT